MAPTRTRRDGTGDSGVSVRHLTAVLALLAVVAAPVGAVASPALPPGPFQTGPTAELVLSPNPAHPGETVILDATNSTAVNGTVVSCEFDVDGDGQYDVTTSDCLQDYSYQRVGEYTLSVRITTSNDREATDTATLDVRENEPPEPAIAVEPETPRPGDAVTLSGAESRDSDGDVVAYRWDLPSGTTSGERVRTTFDRAGNYSIALQVVDDDGAQAETTRIVTVEPNRAPTARLALATADPTAGESVELDASDSTDPEGAIVAYRWDLDGDGDAEEVTDSPVLSFTPLGPGSQPVSVTVVDDRNASDTATVTVDVAPAATATTAPPATTPGDDGVAGVFDFGIVPFVPDVLLAVLLVLVVGLAGAGRSRREAVGQRVDRLRDLLTRGDVRQRLAKKFSGTAVKTVVKNIIKRFSDLIEAGGDLIGEAFERIGQAIKSGTKRLADWLRQFGA